ncbi:MAG: carboxymuconolactone decarboxylase family protein [Acidobacteria bacterium]|nr:carboxymuconolactone decarboxylase family protein [Acidobacteriota bacterium]
MDEKSVKQEPQVSTAAPSVSDGAAASNNGAGAGEAAKIENAPSVVDDQSGVVIPVAGEAAPSSYSMLEPRMKKVYGAYYKELYYTPERRILDPKIQELISIAASLVAKCEGCLDGHMRKALALGATKEEISETICIAAAINAAAIIDETDRSAARLGLNHFPTHPTRQE